MHGARSTVTWSRDGRTVAKRYERPSRLFQGSRHDPFAREWRVGRLFGRSRPPVPTPRLLEADRGRRTLVFEAVDGEVLGEKFPLSLAPGDVEDLSRVASATERFPATARFLKRFDLARRLQRAVAGGSLRASEATAFRRLAAAEPPELVFAHGDLTARNVLRSADDGSLVVVDWEWAGRYPRGWELAFLWFTLVDVEGARRRIEETDPTARQPWFWRSALLVQVLHLGLPGLAPGSPFRPRHVAMRDELVERMLDR